MEFPFARGSPEDRPYDGSLCVAVLPVQPWSIPINRSDTKLATLIVLMLNLIIN